MRISYDPEVDAVYIRLVDGLQECHTLRLNDDVALNIGEGEVLVGIEILDARRLFGAGKLPSIVLDNIKAESLTPTHPSKT